MNFDEKLRTLRRKNGLSQEEFAEKLGVSRQAISRWENGQGYPETEKLVAISEIFSVTLDYLLKEDTVVDGDEAILEEGYYVNREAAEGYILSKKEGSKRMAAGVFIIICSIIPLFYDKSETILSIVIMFLIAAVGITFILKEAFRIKNHGAFEEQPLVFDGKFLESFKKDTEPMKKRYSNIMIVGILTTIISVIYIITSSYLIDIDEKYTILLVLFPLIVAIGVYLIIVSGSGLDALEAICDNKKYYKEYIESKTYAWLYVIAAGIYLLLGMMFSYWNVAWVAFLFAAGIQMLLLKINKK